MWPNPQFSADLVTFTEEIINGKPHFCAVIFDISQKVWRTIKVSWVLFKQHRSDTPLVAAHGWVIHSDLQTVAILRISHT